MTLDAHVRVQINMKVGPISYSDTEQWASDVTPVVMPIMWEDEVIHRFWLS